MGVGNAGQVGRVGVGDYRRARARRHRKVNIKNRERRGMSAWEADMRPSSPAGLPHRFFVEHSCRTLSRSFYAFGCCSLPVNTMTRNTVSTSASIF